VSTATISRAGRVDVTAILPWVLLIGIVVIDIALQPALWSTQQLGFQTGNALPLILIALGQTVVIVTRGVDLSVGGLASLTNCLIATRVRPDTTSIVTWCVLLLLFGAAVGAINGLIIGSSRLQPFVVTLATWSIFAGSALWVLPTPGGLIPDDLIAAPAGTYLGVPRTVLLLAALMALWCVLRRTRTGAMVYAFGSDPVAAQLRGVSRRRTTVIVYAFSGTCAAAAGLFLATQTATGSPTVGTPFILTSIAAVVVGGTSLFGGRGGFLGTVAGAVILTLLADVTFGLGIDSNWSVLAQGALLIGAVALGSATELVHRRRSA
jgi:ribose transport system permease protein